MSDINRIPAKEPITNEEAIVLLQESNKSYREMLLSKEREIRNLANEITLQKRLVGEYRDIIALIKDIRDDARNAAL